MRDGWVLVALVACGGAREQARREAVSFQCRDRYVSYTAAHHMAGDELGVQMDCAEAGPRIKRWKTDKSGNRQEDSHALAPTDFDRVWREIDGTGWPNLHDCTSGTAGKQDPVYVFDVHDDQNKASFSCQSREMPYPWNDIVDPLDSAAARGQQLGDDEPAELKKYDKKDKQR
jgi:hypothetical protein